MTDTDKGLLTERQAQVAGLLARHFGIKEISAELGISTSTVSDHVAALKRIYGATSHSGIVAGYLSEYADIQPGDGPEKLAGHLFRVPESARFAAGEVANDPGALHFDDAVQFPRANWPYRQEPKVVPGWLDGEHATAGRLMAVLLGIFILVATVVLSVSAIDGIGELVGGSNPGPVP